MRGRSAALAGGVLAMVMTTAVPSAYAGRPSLRPMLVIGQLQGPVEGPEGEQQWMLPVDVTDPDGVVWEVEARWDSGALMATTACLQGVEPGAPAHLLLPLTFDTGGRHRVQVRATSLQHCPWIEPGGDEQESRPYTKIVRVPG